jgi:hypothetical protein
VWLYFIVFVIAVAIFLHWRASKKPATAANSGNAFDSPNLTGQAVMTTPWTSDTFVNITNPSAPQHQPHTPNTPTTPTPTTAIARAGQSSDAWINEQTSKFGLYYNQLVALNPTLSGNISKNTDPSKRVFLNDATYALR